MPMVVDHQMPYVQVRVGGRSGYFALDFGATLSSITPSGFGSEGAPQPLPGTVDRYAGFEFFGSWGTVQLVLQPATPRTGRVQQAGVLGTDILAQHVYTLDYPQGRLWRAPREAFCSDEVLASRGLRALSALGYYAADPGALSCPANGGPPRCVNVPTVPLRIGSVRTVAQLDTGYDDGEQPGAININESLFDALQRAGVPLQARPDIHIRLSTCMPGVSEVVEAWQPLAGTPVGLEDVGGQLLAGPRTPDGRREVTLFVKRTPPGAFVCGGVGTWAKPAAQLGASFVSSGMLAIDPFRERIWLSAPPADPPAA